MGTNSKTGERLGSAGVGVLAGMGTNYVWSALKLPGYGKVAFQIGTRQDGEPLHMGWDDVIELVLGGTTIGVGYWKKRGNVIAGGVGFIGGVLVTKLFEAFGAGITPVGPPQITYVPVEEAKVEVETKAAEPVIFYNPPQAFLNSTLGRYTAAPLGAT